MHLTLEFINEKTKGFKPELAIVLGSGLGAFCEGLCGISIPYCDIPGFSPTKVKGHKGELLFCEIYGKKCVIMQGRFHYYEGHPLCQTTFPIKVFKRLGVKKLILTNAAGSLKRELPPGSIMLIDDHINFMGSNPLIGENDDTLGTRFPDMNEVYSKNMQKIFKECAEKLGVELKNGVYCALSGPSYETPAEVKMLSILGGNATGMSTVPEAIVAKYCSIETLGISLITNYAAGLSDVAPNHKEVVEMGNTAGQKLCMVLKEFVKNI